MQDHDDPLVQAQQLIADGRLQMALDLDTWFTYLQAFQASIPDSPGADHRDEILRGMQQFLLERFSRALAPPRSFAEAMLLRLLREAFELVNDADTRLDRRDWTKAARLVLGEPETMDGEAT